MDSSALVKRFVAEKGSDRVNVLVRSGEPVATAKIAYAEIYAGLTRRRREGDVSEGDYAHACRQFEGDWRSYVRVELRKLQARAGVERQEGRLVARSAD
jgi:predicted nucleic acid-binding protein